MPERIARELLNNVYYPVTAIVSLNAAGGITRVRLFDTGFGAAHMDFDPDAREIWLMTNHPEGFARLTEEDKEIIALLRRRAGSAPLRVFITGEDIGCREVDSLDDRDIIRAY